MVVQRRREAAASSGYASYEASDGSSNKREKPPTQARVRTSAQKPAEDQEKRRVNDPQRVKRLSAVAAASVAVALVAAAYGTWAAFSAQASMNEIQAQTQPTLVAAKGLKAGEELQGAALEIKAVPHSLRVEGALGSEALEGSAAIVGKRVLVDVPAGSQMVASVVSGNETSSGLAGVLSAGMQAVTIAVDIESGLSGQIRPADKVRVVAVQGAASGESMLTTLCESARVVSLDASRTGGVEAYASVTVEVTAEQADAIKEAQDLGKVSLVLLSVLDAIPEPDYAAEDEAAALDDAGVMPSFEEGGGDGQGA